MYLRRITQCFKAVLFDHQDRGSHGRISLLTNCILDLRRVFGKYATGVCILLFEKDPSQLKGLTINSFSSVSLEPALVSFSLKTNSKFCSEFDKEMCFSINVLSDKQQLLARACCVSGGGIFSLEDVHKTNFTYYIPGSLVSFFCKIETTFKGGDHTIFLCSILDMLHLNDTAPLVFFDKNYCSLY